MGVGSTVFFLTHFRTFGSRFASHVPKSNFYFGKGQKLTPNPQYILILDPCAREIVSLSIPNYSDLSPVPIVANKPENKP